MDGFFRSHLCSTDDFPSVWPLQYLELFQNSDPEVHSGQQHPMASSFFWHPPWAVLVGHLPVNSIPRGHISNKFLRVNF